MRLPSLSALRAFEAAARHQSFAKAASELCVTEGAVSRHIKLLEQELGVPLFRWLVRKVELTEHGRQLLPILTSAFSQIADAARKIAARKANLRVAAGPSFSIRWLVPRLERFRAMGLGFDVHLTTVDAPISLVTGGSHDVAINCGCWPEPRFPSGITRQRLLSEATTASALRNTPVPRASISPRSSARPTCCTPRPTTQIWSTWAGSFGGPGFNVARDQVFPSRDLTYRAAMMGAGAATGDLALLGEELGSGALMVPFPDCIFRSPEHDYFIVVREDHAEEPRIAAFTRWLIEERDAAVPDLQAA